VTYKSAVIFTAKCEGTEMAQETLLRTTLVSSP